MQVQALHPVTSGRLVMIAVDTTLRAAAHSFANPQIGLLVVCDGGGRTAGVVSKSDIIRHLRETGVVDVPIDRLMSRDVVSCQPEDDLYSTWQRMAEKNLQNMPVVGASSPLGVLDMRDALKALFEQEEYQERLLFNYVAGVGYQ